MRATSWHRPLLVLAALMVPLALVAVVGLALDPREVTGAPLWAKPLKFALSTIIYAVTVSWLIGRLQRMRRAASIAGTIAAVLLGVELVIIVGYAAVGETSHFNVSTPLHTAAWAIMAGSISVVWAATLLVGVALFRSGLGDPAESLALRAGVVLALAGMALGFLMTSPTDGQLANFQGIVGAHTVGTADGGPGIPILGWSTVAGDLRVPHFVGMHALQALPILAIALAALAGRVPLLRDATVRFRLVLIASVAFAAVLAIVTWQALLGQSIVAPSGPILVAGIWTAVGAAAATLAVVGRAALRPSPALR